MSESAPASETGSSSAAHDVSSSAAHDVSSSAAHDVSSSAAHDVSSSATHDMSREELHEATLDAVRWISIARIFAEVVAFSSGIVLAHLVSPAEFGRLAVAVIVNEMAEAITGQGLGNALVQRKVLRRAHLQGGMAIGVGTGLILMALTLLLGPLLITPLFGAQTATLFELFSIVFLLSGIKIVPLAILQRKLDFRTSSLVELSGSLLSACLAVALAASLGLQAKSYVFGQIAAGVLTLGLLLFATKPPLPRIRLAEIRELLSFGLPAAFAGLTWVIQRNIDYMILGVRLSAAQVGYYYRAYTVSFEGESKISGIITRLALPVYARTEDLAHMRSLRARIVRANVTTVFPVLGLFIVLAPEVMPWLFGAHWQPAVLPAQILAVAGMAATINNANSPLLLAAGRPRELSVFNVFQLVGYGATILLCSTHGLVAVCIGVVAFQLAVTLAYAVILNRLVQMPAGQLFSDLAAAVLCTSAMAAVAVVLSKALAGAELPMPLSPMLVGIGAGLTYLSALRLAFPAAWSDVLMIAIRIVPARIRRLVPSAVRGVLIGGAGARASAEAPDALHTSESSHGEEGQESAPPQSPSSSQITPAQSPSLSQITPAQSPSLSQVNGQHTMADPTISVAIPAYNAAAWIGATLDSVLGQTQAPFEVIVVDDGSTDHTVAELERFGERIRLIRQENRGPSAAYNRAFAAASGDYIAMCPADDIWEPHKLQWQTEALAADPRIDIAFGHAREFGLSDADYERPPGEGILENRSFRRAMYEVCLIPAPTALIRRALYERLGPFREDLACEDYEFWMRALAAEAVFYYDPRLLINFRRHGANVSARLLDMREMAYAIHRMYAQDLGDPDFARAVMADDLRQIGRYHLDEGRLAGAANAYRRSLRYGLSARALVGALALGVPGLGGAVRRVDTLARSA